MKESSLPVANRGELMKARLFWRRHAGNLGARNLVSEKAISWLMLCTKLEHIGFNSMKGEIVRPGDIGKWDMFEMARRGGFSKAECLLVADLTASQLAEEERRESLRDRGVDPDNPRELAEADRLDRMSPAELDDEIAHLEGLLGTEK